MEKIISYERFEQKHVPVMIERWNEEWGQAFPLQQRLLMQSTVEDTLLLHTGSWVAIDTASDQQRLVGWVIAKSPTAGSTAFGIASDRGWINLLYVVPSYRNRGIGANLLQRAEAALRQCGLQRVGLGNDLHRRLMPGIPGEAQQARQWLEKHGYVHHAETYDLSKTYSPDEQPDAVALSHAQASIRLAVPEDREALSAFMRRCFPGSWDYQHDDYWTCGGTGREFVLLEQDEEIIGFCRINDEHSPLLAQNIYWSACFEESLGGIGPLGVDERYRGYGYGLAVVQAGIRVLWERGIRQMVIDTTPYLDFYAKFGYDTWKHYAQYDKALS